MSKHHVLIVDDNPEIRSLIRATLGTTFFNLGEASNGEQALAYLETHDFPDLVILDLAMPGVSGFDVMSAIKNDPETAHIGILVLSANADQQTRTRAVNLGAITVLEKPFSPLELLQLVEELFGAP